MPPLFELGKSWSYYILKKLIHTCLVREKSVGIYILCLSLATAFNGCWGWTGCVTYVCGFIY